MKRYLSVLAASAALILMCSTASLAIFPGRVPGTNVPPGFSYGFNNRVGDGTVYIQLQHGWVLGTAAWYSCFATNNLRMAQTQPAGLAPLRLIPAAPQAPQPVDEIVSFSRGLTLAPKLTSAIGAGAQPMYIVTNFNNNGPVFSTSPLTVSPYTGLWEVIYITWNPGVTPWVITNTAAPVGAPPGLPDATQATFSFFPPGTIPGPFDQHTVLDCPIFAVGVLSNPWFKPTSLTPPIVYRIPQAYYVDTLRKQLVIPLWYVYCRDRVTGRVSLEPIIIPDTSDAYLASLIGANYAPALENVPLTDRSTLFTINWAQDINPDPAVFQPLKVLANQFQILSDCPNDCGWRNTSFAYSPVDSFVLLNRDLSLISPEVLFNNVPFLLQQLNRGALIPVPPYGFPPEANAPAVNAPVICFPFGDLLD